MFAQSIFSLGESFVLHPSELHVFVYIWYPWRGSFISIKQIDFNCFSEKRMLKSTQLALGLCKRLLKPFCFFFFSSFFRLWNTWLVFVLTQLSSILVFVRFFVWDLYPIPFGGTALSCLFIRVFLDVEFIVAVAVDLLLFCFQLIARLNCAITVFAWWKCAPHSIRSIRCIWLSARVQATGYACARINVCLSIEVDRLVYQFLPMRINEWLNRFDQLRWKWEEKKRLNSDILIDKRHDIIWWTNLHSLS